MMNRLNITGVYGTSNNPINIDTIPIGTQYTYRIMKSDDASGTFPSSSIIPGNSFVLTGFSSVHTDTGGLDYGVQIMYGFGASAIAIRHCPYNTAGTGTWGAWKYLNTDDTYKRMYCNFRTFTSAITSVAANSAKIINGAAFFDPFRNPILCWWTGQNGTCRVFIIFTGTNATFVPIIVNILNGESITASVSGNDIILSGTNFDWGNGLAIGIASANYF